MFCYMKEDGMKDTQRQTTR